MNLLDALTGARLGAKVGGSKPQRLERIDDYFDRMVFRDVPAEASPGELYFRYLVELAARDREVPLANRTMDGSDHCDGCFEIGRRGEILMFPRRLLPGHRAVHRPRDRPRRGAAEDRVGHGHGRGGARERADVQPGGVQHHGGAGPDGA